MNKSKILKILIIFIFIIFGNLCIANASSEYPTLSEIDGKFAINKTIYDNTANLWCAENGADLSTYHTCLYKRDRTGSVSINNTSSEKDLVFAITSAMNEDKKVGTKSIEEGEMQLAIERLLGMRKWCYKS